jgi:hypothetical protein
MSYSMSMVSQFAEDGEAGTRYRYAKLVVTGLTANTVTNVAHGLTDGKGNAVTPIQVSIEAKSNSNFYENQAADSTNIYVGVGAATGTHACDIYVTY